MRADNVGTGAAISIALTDPLPDGTTVTRTPPYLDAARSATETFDHRVPYDVADEIVLTNTVAVTAKDAGGDPEVSTANNTARATTTVHAPRLTLTRSASRTRREAMTIDLAVANSGSAAATGVTLIDTLPAEVHYFTKDRGPAPCLSRAGLTGPAESPARRHSQKSAGDRRHVEGSHLDVCGDHHLARPNAG
ncbi:hypothetical protein [Streptosporangium sp. NPDC006930]|uniref:hypothetical protein n=1 Tax=unclassified Streptosporangium TaxID=2632669 RepID=UPI003443203E